MPATATFFALTVQLPESRPRVLACFSGESGAAPGMARQGPYGSTWTCSAVGKAKLKIDVPSWGLQTVAYSGAACVKDQREDTACTGAGCSGCARRTEGVESRCNGQFRTCHSSRPRLLSWQQQVQLGYSWFTCFNSLTQAGRSQCTRSSKQQLGWQHMQAGMPGRCSRP